MSGSKEKIPFSNTSRETDAFFTFFNFTVYYHAKLHIITETPYKHENSEQFPCLYYIPRISTAFSIKLIYLSAKNNNILLLFTFPLYTITETPDFCVKVYFCLIVRFFPQSPSYQRHPKTKKLGSTTHRDEPHQALKPLILSHSSILSPASTKNPMALFLNSRLCRCYTLMTFTPLYPIYPTQFDIRQTGFDKLRFLTEYFFLILFI